MQYILSESEYNAMKSASSEAEDAARATIQELCLRVANLTLVEYNYGFMSGHGCVYNEQHVETIIEELGIDDRLPCWDDKKSELEELHPFQEHCDNCPVQKECTLQKSYSK
jgi:transposase